MRYRQLSRDKIKISRAEVAKQSASSDPLLTKGRPLHTNKTKIFKQ